MAWHLEAVGSEGQRGTGDPKTMDLAAHLYKKVADTWKADDFAKFEFPRLVKEDWPTIYKIKYNMADLLYFQRELGGVRPGVRRRRRRRTRRRPRPPRPRTPRCSATRTSTSRSTRRARTRRAPATCRASARTSRRTRDDKYRPKDMTDAQKAMIQSFNRYICYIHPDKNDADGQKQLVEVKYARCRLYFEAQHWEEAAACFRDVAYRPPRQRLGVYAAQLYLESINVLTFHGSPNRTSCFDDMIADVPKFLDMFCTGDKMHEERGDRARMLTKVQCDIQRLRAQRIVEDADKGGNNALELFEKGGKAYFELWEKYGATPLRDEPAAAVREARRDRRERGARLPGGPPRREGDPRAHGAAQPARTGWTRPSSRRRRCYEIGGNYQAIAVYDQASDWYERYAKENPHRKDADKALSDAIVLRLGLGQEDQAVADVKQYQKDYGNSNADRDRADRVRHRRPLRRQGRLGQRAQGALGRDGRCSTRRRRTSRCRRTRRSRAR